MKFDIILAGVGGQGVLSLAAIIASAASLDNLYVRQSEVHGMAQRGGAVLSHLRISDKPISSDLVPRGGAHMILAMEPMESLRYVDYLAPEGVIVSASNPFINIPNYPEIEGILNRVRSYEGSRLVDAEALAKEAQNPRAKNMVIVGAASEHLPLSDETLLKAIEQLFAAKGQDIVDKNHKAFSLGKEALCVNV